MRAQDCAPAKPIVFLVASKRLMCRIINENEQVICGTLYFFVGAISHSRLFRYRSVTM
jgi:hypothetical protein